MDEIHGVRIAGILLLRLGHPRTAVRGPHRLHDAEKVAAAAAVVLAAVVITTIIVRTNGARAGTPIARCQARRRKPGTNLDSEKKRKGKEREKGLISYNFASIPTKKVIVTAYV